MNETKAVILAFAAALILKVFAFDFMVTSGSSMEPAIKSGNVLVISRLRYGFKLPWMKHYLVRWAEPQIGEVVVFFTPSGEMAVKRCKALYESSFSAEGDNDLASYDSRSYGPVPYDNIIGKVLGY
jgi:signal peptidase I